MPGSGHDVLESKPMDTSPRHASSPSDLLARPHGPLGGRRSEARPALPGRRSAVLSLTLTVLAGLIIGATFGAAVAALSAAGLPGLAALSPQASLLALGALVGGLTALLAAALGSRLLRQLLQAASQATESRGAQPDQPTAPMALPGEPAAAAPLVSTAVANKPAAALSIDEAADIRDTLTGAFTQRYFIAAADREWSRIRRHGEDAALLMIDADQLQAINQAHGQECGDAMLVHLTRLVGGTLREYDLMARFNAGVLVVYLPHTDPIGAIDVAERIRDRIASFRLNWPSGTVTVTVSVGVAAVGADHATLDTVIGDAGAALREAKLAGRNCVRAAPVPPKRAPANGSARGDRRTTGPR